jgi:hypothetical protein
LKSAEEGKLSIHYYPEKPDDIPEDDEDLVYAAVYGYKDSGEEILDLVKEYQPDLLPRVLKAIEKY